MLETIWQNLLIIVEQEVGIHVVHTWLKSIGIQHWDKSSNIVYLKAPNLFVQTWVNDNYLTLLEGHLKRLFNVESIAIRFNSTEVRPIKTLDIKQVIQPAKIIQSDKRPYSPMYTAVRKTSPLNDLYSFDNFVVGPNNELSYAACKAVSEHPSKIYNPLFIYGKSGLGKTHLLHAVGNTIKIHHPQARVLYQTTDRFLTEFISAIRLNRVEQFKALYKNVDILLIDDIQFIANKEQTQEVFFHIFNLLHDAQKQIILSSDTNPSGINGLAERLRSRFEWGLVTDIGMPSLETKVAILQKKIALNNYTIPQEVVEYIAYNGAFNVRELEGMLIRIIAHAALNNSPIDLELVKKIVVPTMRPSCTNLGLKEISKVVYRYFNISLTESRSQKRTKHLVFARQIAIYLTRKLTNMPLKKIGNYFGDKDHSTVLYAINKIESALKNDKKVTQLIATLEQELNCSSL